MRADEVFHALRGSGSGGKRQPRLDLAVLQRSSDLDEFGEPPRGEILKAVLAMSGLDPSKRLEELGTAAASRLVRESDAQEALWRAVAFLQAPVDAAEPGAGIPAYAFLPYPVVFVFLARWFHVFPAPAALVRADLSRWVWRGIARAVRQRTRDVNAIKEDDMTGSIGRLLDAVGESMSADWTLEPFHANHAASRVEMLALLSREPRDRAGPVSWRALLSSGARVAREIFRVARVDEGDRALARTVANRVLLDTNHSNLQAELRRWTWAAQEDALQSHLIDAAGYDDLVAGNVASFLGRRGSRVRSLVTSLLERRAGLGEPRVLPVESYYEQESRAERGDSEA
jgi:hypothetical protein